MDINKFFNHIKMCLNAVTILREDLLPDHQSIKRHSEFEEYFFPDRNHPSYSWNVQIYTSLGHSLFVAMTNDTCVKPSMTPQSYKVVRNYAHEISGWNILSIILYSREPHLVGMNGDVQSDLSTLAFKNGEQLEDFHSRILRLQQEIMLSGEIVSPTRLVFQYTKALTNSEKLRAFIAPKMTDLITFLDENGKYAVYTGGDIHGIYRYIEMIVAPNTLTTSVQHSHYFGLSSSSNNDAETIHQFIEALRMIQKIICECCGRIGHKVDACIIRGPKPPPTKS